MEAAGIEPSTDFDATRNSICDCENCQQCRAANALHFECFKSQFLASLDINLQRLIECWEHLDTATHRTIASQLGQIDCERGCQRSTATVGFDAD
jgi:hypothetical protein